MLPLHETNLAYLQTISTSPVSFGWLLFQQYDIQNVCEFWQTPCVYAVQKLQNCILSVSLLRQAITYIFISSGHVAMQTINPPNLGYIV